MEGAVMTQKRYKVGDKVRNSGGTLLTVVEVVDDGYIVKKGTSQGHIKEEDIWRTYPK